MIGSKKEILFSEVPVDLPRISLSKNNGKLCWPFKREYRLFVILLPQDRLEFFTAYFKLGTRIQEPTMSMDTQDKFTPAG